MGETSLVGKHKELKPTIQESWRHKTYAIMANGIKHEYHLSDEDYEDEFGGYHDATKSAIREIEKKTNSKIASYEILLWKYRTTTTKCNDEMKSVVVCYQQHSHITIPVNGKTPVTTSWIMRFLKENEDNYTLENTK